MALIDSDKSMRLDEINAINQDLASVDEDRSRPELLVKLNVFNLAYHNLEMNFHQEGTEAIHGSVPFPCSVFVDLLLEAAHYFNYDTRSKKFLDVGCGVGTKVLLASSFFDAYGVEYNSDFVEQAKQLGIDSVFCQDAMMFGNYADYDLIYFYRLFKDFNIQRMFEAVVLSQIKEGAIFAPMGGASDWKNFPGIEQISDYWYKKGASSGEP